MEIQSVQNQNGYEHTYLAYMGTHVFKLHLIVQSKQFKTYNYL